MGIGSPEPISQAGSRLLCANRLRLTTARSFLGDFGGVGWLGLRVGEAWCVLALSSVRITGDFWGIYRV